MTKKDPHFTFPKGLIPDLTAQEKLVQEAIERQLAPYNTTSSAMFPYCEPPSRFISVMATATAMPGPVIPYIPIMRTSYYNPKTDDD